MDHGDRSWRISSGARSMAGKNLDHYDLKLFLPHSTQINVLLLHVSKDKIVNIGQPKLMYKQLTSTGKNEEFIKLKNEDHYLSKRKPQLEYRIR